MRTYYSYPAIESAYQTVEDEGIALPQQTILDFQGAGVTVTDGGTKTIVTIPGGGGVTPAALTNTDDTNIALVLTGTPAAALLQSVNIAVSWVGTLADSRIASAATWNAKQDAISLTTTGSSGAATFLANVLNIPNYTLSGLGGVPTSRQLTINGVTYDLSADRNWSVGTVTSVGFSAGTGISLSGTNPITGSGTITITNSASRTAGVNVDGQGGVISTGNKGYALIATGGTISRWYLSGKNGETGSITFDLKVGGVSIVGAGTKPFTTTSQNNDAAPSGWTTTTLASGSRLEFVVDSATSCTWYNLTIVYS